MSVLAVKLGRDLRASWGRVTLMVVAIAVSLIAFSSVLYSWSTVSRETEQAYLSTGPASATIRFSPGLDPGQMATVAAQAGGLPGVLEATGRAQFASEVEVNGQPRDLPMQVFVAAPDDPLRMARFFVEDRAWPPEPGEIYLGRDSLVLLGATVGDTVTLQSPDGARLRLQIAGRVYDPSLSPAGQEQSGRGYLSTASLAEAGLLDQLKIQVGQGMPSRDRDQVVSVAGRVGEWLQREHGCAVQEIQVPPPYAHPHQGQADALLTALAVGAAAALLLSTILVANMLNGLFAQQIPQIGIMKAVGGRSGRIGRLYLAMTLSIAGAATLLAFVPGIVVGRSFVPSVFRFLGIQPANVDAQWWTYPVVLAAGLLLPPLMALVPLVRASRTTVRAAIQHHGGTAYPYPAARLGQVLRRLPGLDRGLLMAVRNTVRRPARFLLAVGLLASAGMVFVAGISARDGMAAVEDETAARLQWDVTVQLATAAPAGTLAQLERAPGVERVEGWTIATASLAGPGQLPVTRTYPDQGHGRLAVTAIPDGSTLFTRPGLRDGRWPGPRETGTIVLNQVTLANTDLDLHIGETVQLTIAGKATTWRLVGIAEERTAASSAYVTAEGLASALGEPPTVNALRIATTRHDEPARQASADRLSELLIASGADVLSAESVGRQQESTSGHLEPVLVVLLATALPMGVIGCVGIASTMGASVLERTREFGVMHAIGARPSAVRRIVVAEGILIALASCLVAVLPALGLTAAIGSVLGNSFMYAPLPYRVSWPAAVGWLAVAILGAMLATEAAASRASRMTVREALAHL